MYTFTDDAKKIAVTPTKLLLEELLALVESHKKSDIQLITRGYEFSKKAHAGQKRYSGKPYFHHPFETAKYLAALQMPASMIVAGILHDTVEDTDVESQTIVDVFGEDIAEMVEGVTKLKTIRYYGVQRRTESLRKLFAATSRDIRVMVIKLMDRLYNARTLQFVPAHKRGRIALETLEIYAPIADRLGMGLVKRELEEAVFSYAFPKEYKKIIKVFKNAGGEDLKRLERIQNNVHKKLAEHGVEKFRTKSRVKGLYSFYRKLERKDSDITKIFDIWALRIIVDSVADCYTVLGIVHGEWRPIPGRVKDYIAFPKPNGYKGIHTTIHTGDGSIIEIQIRTEEMHRKARFGIISHFSYKDNVANKKLRDGAAVNWIRRFIPTRLLIEDQKPFQKGNMERARTDEVIPDWLKNMVNAQDTGDKNSRAFLQNIKSDFFNHRVFVFTPRGDMIDLPLDSSPIDFAYAIHSEIGNKMSGAKVNGKIVLLSSCLRNGDIVEIVTSEKTHPNRKWIHMAKTILAKRHIRTYLQRAGDTT